MTEDHIRTTLKLHLDDGNAFTTRFDISTKFLKERSIQQIVDEYYVRRIYTQFNEISRIITKVDVLDYA